LTLIDSSVWINFFRGAVTPETDALDLLLSSQPVAIGDLMLTEVLQGFRGDRDFCRARKLLTSLTFIELGGRDIAVRAARNYRALRKMGITIRKTIDTVIATRCIESGIELLHADHDFDPFVQHLGLRSVL
jgi:predicted nucleic acid-binding protein